MARGLPAFWSTVVSIPFLATGGYVAVGRTQFQPEAGVPILLFGGFVILVGLYVQFRAAPEKLEWEEGEKRVGKRHPTQKAAAARIILGVPFLALSGYLLFFTFLPYVYPTVAGTIGGTLLLTGLTRYWRNTLTTYWLTNRYVIKEYRFLGMARNFIPLDEIEGSRELKTPIEALVGVGHVAVASAGDVPGGTTSIETRAIPESEEFARQIRRLS